jgi:hypothetical protein
MGLIDRGNERTTNPLLSKSNPTTGAGAATATVQEISWKLRSAKAYATATATAAGTGIEPATMKNNVIGRRQDVVYSTRSRTEEEVKEAREQSESEAMRRFDQKLEEH